MQCNEQTVGCCNAKRPTVAFQLLSKVNPTGGYVYISEDCDENI